MKFLKQYWREIAIALLAILFLSKCSSSGNYERKYKKEVARVEFVTDSLTKINTALTDSLNMAKMNNSALQSQNNIYKDQNNKLSDAAKRQVVVRVNKK